MNRKTINMEIIRPDELPDQLRSSSENITGRAVTDNGRIYLKLEHTVISCPDDDAGREFVYDVLLASRRDNSGFGERGNTFFRILSDPGFFPDPDLLKRERIDPSVRRCVAVFHASVPMNHDLTSVLADIAPMEKGDILIPVNYHESAFIRELGLQSVEELIEYTEAVIGTMESEGIAGIKAGIGNEADDLEHLRNSYEEAMDALSTGMRFHSRDTVYRYSGQVLDRILNSIPDEKKKEIRKKLFIGGTPGGLSDEMIETVRVFFRNDLNLTAASRQLFIHRNTLNYRLDKIRKETGLDLRSFEDAVIFRIISGIPADT